MDVDKLKRWLDTAQQFQGNDFWSEIFDESNAGKPKTSASPEQPGEQTAQLELPLIDILQRDREWVVFINLPGVEKDDVQLSIAGNRLNIRGVVRAFYQDATLIQSERLSGSFDRTIQLPESVHQNNASAAFRNGILEIRIPRTQPPEQEIKID